VKRTIAEKLAIFTPEQRRYLNHRMKHGPDLPREELAEFLREVIRKEMKLDPKQLLADFLEENSKQDHVTQRQTYIY
jgi:hypothetical protein